MDMFNKRTAGSITQIRIPSKDLSNFQEDGYTVAKPRRLDVEVDLRDHLVLASEAALEPGAEERPAIQSRAGTLEEMGSAKRSVSGENRKHSQSESCASDATNPAHQGPLGGSTIRVVISKQQLAQLLAEGSIKKSAGCEALLPPSALPNDGPLVGDDMAQIISNAMNMTRSPGSPWSPRLDTITEAPSQLTRSPVITRNCEAVENFLQTRM